MKKLSLVIPIFFTALIGIVFLGCEKVATTEQEPGSQNSVEATAVNSLTTFDGLNSMTDLAFNTNNLKSGTLGTCPIVTANIAQVPYILTFDWGTGCTGDDGVARSGKIIISLTGLMNVPSNVATFTFVDFFNDGNKITGVHRITYAGLNTANNWPRYEVFTEAKITFPDNTFITYRSEQIRLMAEGSSTTSWTDDVWRIEGTSTGKTRAGVSWAATCNQALVKKNSCNWFSSGTLVVTPEGGLARTVDFGDGACDNKATLTIADKTINLEL